MEKWPTFPIVVHRFTDAGIAVAAALAGLILELQTRSQGLA